MGWCWPGLELSSSVGVGFGFSSGFMRFLASTRIACACLPVLRALRPWRLGCRRCSGSRPAGGPGRAQRAEGAGWPARPSADASGALDAAHERLIAGPDGLGRRRRPGRRVAGFGRCDQLPERLRPLATGGAGDSVAVISTPRAARPSTGAALGWSL